MQTAWWIIGAGLLIWGLRTEGVGEALWSLLATAVAIVLVVAFLAVALHPTGAVIVSTLLVAIGTWRLMWWLTDRGYI